ncbi:serine/threonine-protein kinase STY46 [Trifolium repens]|nr:serine/threonine-protein kinase STY46 [Trifolium repens]
MSEPLLFQHHLPCGEMTVTLDDVRCLLHLPIQGRLLHHTGIPSKANEVTWMKDLLGTTDRETEDEVRKIKGAHIIFLFLKELTHGTHPNCKYVAGYMTLLQAWIYDHFEGTGGLLWVEYKSEMPTELTHSIPCHPEDCATIMTTVEQIFKTLFMMMNNTCHCIFMFNICIVCEYHRGIEERRLVARVAIERRIEHERRLAEARAEARRLEEIRLAKQRMAEEKSRVEVEQLRRKAEEDVRKAEEAAMGIFPSKRCCFVFVMYQIYEQSEANTNKRSRLKRKLAYMNLTVEKQDEWQTILTDADEMQKWLLNSDSLEFSEQIGHNSYKGSYMGKKLALRSSEGATKGALMKFMQGGSVHDLISKNKKLQNKDIVRIAVDVAEGIKFMNDHGVAHRDLNTQRIMLDKHGSACLGDLGIVTACKSNQEAMDYETDGYRWLAPEVRF